jgi:hypothetical protein
MNLRIKMKQKMIDEVQWLAEPVLQMKAGNEGVDVPVVDWNDVEIKTKYRDPKAPKVKHDLHPELSKIGK